MQKSQPALAMFPFRVAADAEDDMDGADEEGEFKHHAICHAIIEGFDGGGGRVVEELLQQSRGERCYGGLSTVGRERL